MIAIQQRNPELVDILTPDMVDIVNRVNAGSVATAATYVTMALSAALPNERVLTAGDGIDLTDGGAGGNATLAVDVTDFIDTNFGLTENANDIRINAGTGLQFVAGVLTTNDAQIDHDALLNFVGNEHIDHTAVTLTAGDGLTGGGDISANRSFAVNVDDATIEINADTLRVKADGINDTHIDWGVGANQVSAVDVPIADAGGYYAGGEVETALQEIGAGTAGPYVLRAGDTMTGNLILDDGAGDSPSMQFVGGSNNDTVTLFLDDDATGGDSDFIIRLCDTGGDSNFYVQDSTPANVLSLNTSGNLSLATIDGIDINPGSDTDADLITVGVTGSPILKWDESEDVFEFSKSIVTQEFFGIGTSSTPSSDFHLQRNAISNIPVLSAATGALMEATGAAGQSINWSGISGNTGGVAIWFGDTDNQIQGRIAYRNASDSFSFTTNNNIQAMILDSNQRVGIGTMASGNVLGQLHVDQLSTTAAIPVAYFDQADVSEEMFEFNTTIGVGNAIEAIGAKTLTTTHFIKVTLPGALTRYIPVGTIA